MLTAADAPQRAAVIPEFRVRSVFDGGIVRRRLRHAAEDLDRAGFERVDAASRRLSSAVTKAKETAERAAARVIAAQKNADALARHSASLINLVKELAHSFRQS